ncbi:MAG: type VI secretion system-associated protein TagF [Burkholderiales bacterium]|nr:type VI secretion system-associated protein TagF [Burkholderiales bacterium]
MAADDVPGWFGKLSMLGDFASRRLAPEWVRGCDVWLSACVRESRQSLGDEWMRVYLSAPVWRFAWAPGVVDAQWWFGALMPSCDSVGRYFPLLIAQARADAPTDRIALDHLDLWWAHVARAGLATLADGATLEGFEEALAHAPPWPSPRRAHYTRPMPEAGRERLAVAANASLADVAGSLAANHWLQRLANTGLWWPMAAPGAPGSCTFTPGMPPAAAYAQMLRGQW